MDKPKKHPNRIVFPLMDVGNQGKSLTLTTVADWCLFAKVVPFAACDCDTVNHTFYDRNKANVNLLKGTPSGWLKETFKALKPAPVTLMDFPSMRTKKILEEMEAFGIVPYLERQNTRFTILLFMDGDLKSRESVSKVVRHFQETADYLLVDNPKQFNSEAFRQSPLYHTLKGQGVPEIELPEINDISWNSWSAAERVEHVRIPLNEVVSHEKIHEMDRFNLQTFRNRMLVQWEDVAVPWIVPSESLIKQKVTRVVREKAEKTDALNDPLL